MTSPWSTSSLRRSILRQRPVSGAPHSSRPFSQSGFLRSSTPPSPSPSPPPKVPTGPWARWKRIPFFASVSSRPVSSTVAFLILHELTAVIPLVGITAALQWSDPLPVAAVNEYMAGAFSQGLDKFGRYFARKGWFGFELDDQGKVVGRLAWETGQDGEEMSDEARERYKLISHVALAYALTKVLLPVRIYVSAVATPWFANTLMRVTRIFKGTKTTPKP